MAKSKYKVTGFARFFLFMFIFVPAVLAGVSFYKFGTVSVDSIKDVLSNQSIERTVDNKIEILENDILKLEAKIEVKRQEIDVLRSQQ